MLTRLGPNAARSSDGFSIRRTDRTTLRYSEGVRSVDIEVETGQTALYVYWQSLVMWSPPNEFEAVTPDDRERILRHTGLLLDYLKIPYAVDPAR
jgi:hypothetical protein